MKPKLLIRAVIAAFASVICVSAADSPGQQTVSPAYMKPAGSRTFAIDYIGKVSGIPGGTKRLRVWLPVPQNSTVQSIRDLTFSSPPKFATESKYGNRIAYWEVDQPGSSHEATMRFVCDRKEILMDLAKLATDGQASPAAAAFLQADKLVLVDDEIRKMADEITANRKTTLEKARAIYDFVLGK